VKYVGWIGFILCSFNEFQFFIIVLIACATFLQFLSLLCRQLPFPKRGLKASAPLCGIPTSGPLVPPRNDGEIVGWFENGPVKTRPYKRGLLVSAPLCGIAAG
jgi:hypothetical protein